MKIFFLLLFLMLPFILLGYVVGRFLPTTPSNDTFAKWLKITRNLAIALTSFAIIVFLLISATLVYVLTHY